MVCAFFVMVGIQVEAASVKEINFGIISTESRVGLKSIWEPLLRDMEKKLGMKVNAYFASDYAGIIEAMRFNKVQIAWYGNKSAIEAVDRAQGEVFVQTVAADGSPGYWSLIITHKNSEIKTLENALSNGKKYTFGNGDPNSTSGFLVPGYYVFAQNNIDPVKHFKRVVNANHETNALAVANRQVDLATNNTENMDRLKKTHPEAFNNIRILWKSPLIPSDPLVWRTDLPADVKKRIRDFFLTYGKTEPEKKVLADLAFAPFRESSNKQLIPIRQLELFKQKIKIEQDMKMDASEKKAKLAKVNSDIEKLQREAK
jgi:phosphonate transport system substrate-binding protein